MWTNVFIVIAVIVSCGLSLGIETSVLINETTQWCSYMRVNTICCFKVRFT